MLKRKPLKRTPFKKKKLSKEKIKEREEEINKMREFFLSLWKKLPHYCIICGAWLGTEPRSYNFHHVIPKQCQKNYKIDITYDEKNIIFVCLNCHSGIENYGITTASLHTLKTNLLDDYEDNRIKRRKEKY